MKKYRFLILFCYLQAIQNVSAQEVLPNITVKDYSGKIIVSWQNAYTIPVTNINIQRSFDSSKNYSSIGSVLNPQNLENGFADDNPPYNKMYYRLFISFEGGAYTFSAVARPVKDPPLVKRETAQANIDITAAIPEENAVIKPIDSITKKTIPVSVTPPRFPWEASTLKDAVSKKNPERDSAIIAKKNPEIITYPSQRIFTGKENNLVILLKDAPVKKYSVKFFDENDNFLFEITKLKEEYLVLEKVNFVRSGWFHFQLFENGKLIEKNKFFLARDIKPESNRRGNN